MFQMRVSASSDSKGVRKTSDSKSKKQLKGIDVCFRMVACFNLQGARVRLKPSQNSFVVTDKSNQSVEITVTAAQKLEWVTAWSKIDCMEHSQQQRLEVPESAVSEAKRTTPRSSESSPRSSSPSGSPRKTDDEEEVDEIEALMALGMYDTAVLRQPPEGENNEADNQFLSMVGQMKRRDGKARISLEELFVPPPGLVVKEWKASMRMMKKRKAKKDEKEGVEVEQEEIEDEADEKTDMLETEEGHLRAMLANMQVTLRFMKSNV